MLLDKVILIQLSFVALFLFIEFHVEVGFHTSTNSKNIALNFSTYVSH